LGAAEVRKFWEPLELFGGIDDEARVVQEGPSGHFGRLALVELDVALSGVQAVTPVALVLAMQELGLMVVQLSGVRGSEMRNPQLPKQASTQADVLPRTCVALVGLKLPAEALSSGPRFPQQGLAKSGHIAHSPPAKFAKVLAAEKALAEQRRQPSGGVVVFRGLPLLAPEEQLRPRPSSGALVDAALAALGGAKAEVRVLDLGVGSGALLLAILHELGERSSGTGVDIDSGALSACRSNASRVLAPAHAARVEAVLCDFRQLDSPEVRPLLAQQGYDLVVCNPPYRTEAQQEAYSRAIGHFGGHAEHTKTLVAGETGLEMYEAIAACLSRDAEQARRRCLEGRPGLGPLLRMGGTLVFQVEAGRRGSTGGVAARVAAAVECAGHGRLAVCGLHLDKQGLERALLVRHAGPQPSSA